MSLLPSTTFPFLHHYSFLSYYFFPSFDSSLCPPSFHVSFHLYFSIFILPSILSSLCPFVSYLSFLICLFFFLSLVPSCPTSLPGALPIVASSFFLSFHCPPSCCLLVMFHPSLVMVASLYIFLSSVLPPFLPRLLFSFFTAWNLKMEHVLHKSRCVHHVPNYFSSAKRPDFCIKKIWLTPHTRWLSYSVIYSCCVSVAASSSTAGHSCAVFLHCRWCELKSVWMRS